MAGFGQQPLNYRALSGNQVAVFIGDNPVAFAQTVTHTLDFGSQSYYGIGSANPQEIQQLRLQPNITITAFALTQNGQAIAGQSGGISSFLANNSFNFTIVDRNGNHLFTYVGGVAQSFNENIPTNQTITDTVSFLCMDCLDVTGQSILNVGNALGVSNTGGGSPAGGANLGINVRVGSGGVSVGGSLSAQFGGIGISAGGSF